MTWCLRGAGVSLYSPKGPTCALRSNRLEGRRRCSLGRWWRNIPEADRRGPPPGAGWHQGGVGRSHQVASRALPWGVASWGPLESSRIVFVVVKFNSFWRFDLPFWFSGYTYRKYRFTKTCRNCQFKPLSFYWWSISSISSCYVDGLIW
jgi:hypothetical protein